MFDSNGNLIFRADLEVQNKFELYSVSLSGNGIKKLSQQIQDYNDVHSYWSTGPYVAYIADVGLEPRHVYSVNTSGTRLQKKLSNFVRTEAQAFSGYRGDTKMNHYFALSENSTWIGINGNGNNEDVIDCYIIKVDGSIPLTKVSPNIAPGSFGCNHVRMNPHG